MPTTIERVEARNCTPGQPGEYRVRRNVGVNIYVYAKDELDAYTKGLAVIEEEEKNMRTFAICATIAFLALVSGLVYGCGSRDARYSADMRACVAAGKSYVSEDEGYSCRDAGAAPKQKGQT